MRNRFLRPPLYARSDARKRLRHLLDRDSFTEFLDPRRRIVNPNLRSLDVPVEFDDGVVIGSGALDGTEVYCAAQQGGFIGGAVGEIHGAKITGLLERAIERRPAAVLLLVDSGGVRLHEANAGLIAISEIARALLDVRAAGIPCLALVGGAEGAFGGMGVLARLCDHLIMNERGRMGMSGPLVIQNVMGVEAFDATDRAMIWRTYGGKHRYLIGEADRYAGDSIAAFRRAAIELIRLPRPVTLESLRGEHRRLRERLRRFGGCRDSTEVWRALGIDRPEEVQGMATEEFLRLPRVEG
jgi:malonate decarboxylase beta subunit